MSEKVLAIFTLEETQEILCLDAKRKVAKKIFHETNIDNYANSYNLWMQAMEDCNKKWYELEEKYSLEHSLNYSVNDATGEVIEE